MVASVHIVHRFGNPSVGVAFAVGDRACNGGGAEDGDANDDQIA